MFFVFSANNMSDFRESCYFQETVAVAFNNSSIPQRVSRQYKKKYTQESNSFAKKRESEVGAREISTRKQAMNYNKCGYSSTIEKVRLGK